MDKTTILKLAKQCMFSFSDDEIAYVEKNFEILNQQIAILDEIDTTNIDEMVFPFEQPRAYLREDVVDNVKSKQQILKNAMQKDDDFIKLNLKVVK